MTESIDLNFFLQRDEYYAAMEFHRQQRAGLSTDKKVGGILILLGAASWIVLGNVALSVALFVTGISVALLSHPLRARAFRTRWEREPLFRSEQTISFDDQSIYFRMGRVESNLPWTYYESWLESGDGFLLMYGDTFNFFPKRAFSDEAAVKRFREMIAKKIR
jgi:YcxB-like protein